MRSRSAGLTFLVTSAILCVTLLVYRSSNYDECAIISEPYHPVPLYLRQLDATGDGDVIKLQDALKRQRNQLAKELNALRKKLGQQDCEKDANKETNEAGGWCKTSSKEDGGQHMTDMKLKAALSQFFKGKTVGSFGDGPGAYKREILKDKLVKSYDAYDGAPYCEETSEGRVTFMDLTVPQYNIPIYDWILSLEVAEHIPKEFEAVYMDNMARHSREGIVMSWAVPEQGGLAHINNSPLEYVVKLLDGYGFRHDKNASSLLQKASSFQWLVQNINVYRRYNTTNLNVIEKWFT